MSSPDRSGSSDWKSFTEIIGNRPLTSADFLIGAKHETPAIPVGPGAVVDIAKHETPAIPVAPRAVVDQLKLDSVIREHLEVVGYEGKIVTIGQVTVIAPRRENPPTVVCLEPAGFKEPGTPQGYYFWLHRRDDCPTTQTVDRWALQAAWSFGCKDAVRNEYPSPKEEQSDLIASAYHRERMAVPLILTALWPSQTRMPAYSMVDLILESGFVSWRFSMPRHRTGLVDKKKMRDILSKDTTLNADGRRDGLARGALMPQFMAARSSWINLGLSPIPFSKRPKP